MSFNDRLRSMFERIDEHVEREGLDWSTTIHRARRSRTIYLGSVVAGTVAVMALGAVGARAVLLSERSDSRLGPATSPTREATPTPTPTPTPAAECSGERDYHPRLDWSLEFETAARRDLPAAVRNTMTAIVEAARTCDYDELERIAYEGNAGFNYSFGGGNEPARDWKRIENEDDPELREEVTSIMITLLNMRHAVDCYSASIGCAAGDEGLYIWPRAFGPDPTDRDWQEIVDVGLYTQEEVDQMRESGIGYSGYRIGILKDGDWLFFVAGD
ncbi:MAG: hypothetical protein ACRDI3_06475 [Actinomycetota bacterium]